ncbi:MAG: aminotransferase class I/II-fold pyridoxal phosphate-dependent enzyme [Lachnospiraceae bacterium]|nr:aminotransferase class I/II-fold pyridoxal phosphate-dependent enzyme [Lachnospiraceae bacterium]
MKKYICEGLAEYLSMDRKPWHMPGHKRKNFIKELDEKAGLDVAAFLSCDVTEVSGTDDLHHPEEMILKSQQQLARIYDSYASFYMVNGSTGGILSAIGAVAECGKVAGKNKIIIARNCHKSVYNGVKLFGLEPIYVEPEYMELEEGYISNIYSGIKAHQIKALVEQHQNVCAVVITSPTYEGVVSDVSGIRKVLKPRGIPFIVDEAHGAHLSFIDGIFQLPLSAVSLGADIVVQSLHKTLPALTQTAVLHINDERFETGIRKYLSIFMSSSPSYPMLCSMEEAVVGSWEIKQRDGYEEYLNILRTFRENISKLKNIKLLEKTNCDETRIVLYGNWSGEMLAERLRELGNIEIEMSGVNYVVLISTYVDEPENFAHLERTIKLLDEELDKWESVEATFSEEQLYELVGKVAIDNIYVYPPGSYIVAAGEKITEEAVEKILKLRKSGKRIVGI